MWSISSASNIQRLVSFAVTCDADVSNQDCDNVSECSIHALEHLVDEELGVWGSAANLRLERIVASDMLQSTKLS